MSTRCNVIVVGDWDEELIFYRHCDGYPEGTMPALETFLEWCKEGRIRSNVGQAAGWLIVLGNQEYKSGPEPAGGVSGWKVGAFEPTTGIHDDIEFLYVVDLDAKTISIDGQDGYKYAGKYSEPAEA